MAIYRLDVVFDGVPNDDESLESLGAVPDVHWGFRGGVAHAVAFVTTESPVEAADRLVHEVVAHLPDARPLFCDQELVGISDVASRLGVTREAVRHWVNGARRRGAPFPIPVGEVGDGVKIWTWSDVNTWLDQNLALGDGYSYPNRHHAAEMDILFARWRRRDANFQPGRALPSERTSIHARCLAHGSTTWIRSDSAVIGMPVGLETLLSQHLHASRTVSTAWTHLWSASVSEKQPVASVGYEELGLVG